jgi:hypothetical protein
MAKKKEEKKEEPKKEVKKEIKKVEKKVVKKEQPKLYSLEELAEIFGYSKYQMSSLFSIRGIDKNKKISIEDAKNKFKNVMI